MRAAADRGMSRGSAASHAFGAAAAIVLACALAYAPALRGGFVYDDHIYVEDNPFVQTPANLRHLLDWRFYGYDQGVLAGSRPAFLASLLADRALWGSRPAGYHLTNLVLHAANALCVAALGAALGLGALGGTLAGLLFAVQPLLSEAVCGVSFRADLLAALFAFGCVFLLRGATAAPRRGFVLRALAAAALYLLSLMSKESAALVPLAALVPWGGAPRLGPRRLALALALLAAAGGFYAAFRAPRFRYELVIAPPLARPPVASVRLLPPEPPRWQYPPSPPPWGEIYVNPATRLWTMSAETGASLRRLAWPGRPAVERAPTLRRAWHDPAVLASWLLAAAVAAAAFALRAAAPPAAAGAAWALAALAVVSGVAPLYNPTADRYLYLPMAGAAWMLSAALLTLGRRKGAGPAAALAALFVLCWGRAARRRAAEWASDRTLFFAAADGPQSPRVAYNRALVLLGENRSVEAEDELRAAVRAHPGFAEAWTKLGALEEALGELDKARFAFARGAAEAAPSPLLPYAFARFLERRGELPAAAAVYRSALARDPGFEPAQSALAALKGPGTN